MALRKGQSSYALLHVRLKSQSQSRPSPVNIHTAATAARRGRPENKYVRGIVLAEGDEVTRTEEATGRVHNLQRKQRVARKINIGFIFG